MGEEKHGVERCGAVIGREPWNGACQAQKNEIFFTPLVSKYKENLHTFLKPPHMRFDFYVVFIIRLTMSNKSNFGQTETPDNEQQLRSFKSLASHLHSLITFKRDHRETPRQSRWRKIPCNLPSTFPRPNRKNAHQRQSDWLPWGQSLLSYLPP